MKLKNEIITIAVQSASGIKSAERDMKIAGIGKRNLLMECNEHDDELTIVDIQINPCDDEDRWRDLAYGQAAKLDKAEDTL